MKQPGVSRRDTLDGELYIPEGAEPPPADPNYLMSETFDGVAIDENKARLEGNWGSSTNLKPHVDDGYSYSAEAGASATFKLRVKKSGPYELRYFWVPHENRAKDAKIEITDSKGTRTLTVNLSEAAHEKHPWRTLGVFEFVDVLDGKLVIRQGEQGGTLHADCVHLVPAK